MTIEMEYKFKVCPVQGRQLLDVRKEDIFEDFRICDTYRGGGGYDQLPEIIKKRRIAGKAIIDRISEGYTIYNLGKQFVVQLRGCHLRCPYCYVTSDGIFGKYKEYNDVDMINSFLRAKDNHDVGVFHLMGGAPALYLKRWKSILYRLPPYIVFTSDLLLTEDIYDKDELSILNTPNSIYAVNIKGLSDKNYRENTGRDIDWAMFWVNLERVVNSGINYYLTFTNPDLYLMNWFTNKLIDLYGRSVIEDSFVIDLKEYEAIKEGSAWD
jgi:pyruvate-formate lyase-activating enzyme